MTPETRAFLDSVRHAEDPTPADEDRVRKRVVAALAAGAVVLAGVSSSSALAGTGAGASKAAKLFALSSGATGLKLSAALLVVSGAAVWGSSTVLAPSQPAPAPSVVAFRAQRARSAALEAPAPTAALETAASAASSPRKERARIPVGRGPAVAERPSDAARPESLRSELALLAEVQRALEQGNGEAALRRLDAHVTSDRQLLAERKSARILALCAAGRVAEAREAAAEFMRDDARSLQRAAIERSCAGKEPPAER